MLIQIKQFILVFYDKPSFIAQTVGWGDQYAAITAAFIFDQSNRYDESMPTTLTSYFYLNACSPVPATVEVLTMNICPRTSEMLRVDNSKTSKKWSKLQHHIWKNERLD